MDNIPSNKKRIRAKILIGVLFLPFLYGSVQYYFHGEQFVRFDLASTNCIDWKEDSVSHVQGRVDSIESYISKIEGWLKSGCTVDNVVKEINHILNLDLHSSTIEENQYGCSLQYSGGCNFNFHDDEFKLMIIRYNRWDSFRLTYDSGEM